MRNYPGMTAQRHRELESTQTDDLTPEEAKAGWHFCPDWDYMLIHKFDPEMVGCCCSWKEGKL